MYVIIRNGKLFALENDEKSAEQTKEAALDLGGNVVIMEISTLENLRTTLIVESTRYSGHFQKELTVYMALKINPAIS